MEITSRNSIQRISKPHYIYMPLHIGTGSYIGTNLYIYKAYLLITHIYTCLCLYLCIQCIFINMCTFKHQFLHLLTYSFIRRCHLFDGMIYLGHGQWACRLMVGSNDPSGLF